MSTFQGGTAYDTYTLAPAGVGIPAKITDYFTGAVLTPDEPVKTTKNGAYRTFTISTTSGYEVHVVWVEFPGVEPQLQVSIEQQASAGLSGRLTGSVPSEAELPDAAALGDAYVTEDDLNLYVWMTGGFVHVGSMRGPGTTDSELAALFKSPSEVRAAVEAVADDAAQVAATRYAPRTNVIRDPAGRNPSVWTAPSDVPLAAVTDPTIGTAIEVAQDATPATLFVNPLAADGTGSFPHTAGGRVVMGVTVKAVDACRVRLRAATLGSSSAFFLNSDAVDLAAGQTVTLYGEGTLAAGITHVRPFFYVYASGGFTAPPVGTRARFTGFTAHFDTDIAQADFVQFSGASDGGRWTGRPNASSSILDTSVVGKALSRGDVLSSTSSVTIGVPSDFPTLQAAFEEYSRRYMRRGSTVEVLIESGHRPASGLSLVGGDWSAFRITSASGVVSVADDFMGDLIRCERTSAPMLACIVDMRDRGAEGYYLLESIGHVEPYCGVRNAGARGLYVGNTSTCFADWAESTGSHDRNVWVSRGSTLCAERANFSANKGGDNAVYVSRSSLANLEYAVITDAFLNALCSTRSWVTATGADLSRAAAKGIITNGRVNCANVIIEDCGGDGIWAEQASTVLARDAVILRSGLTGMTAIGGSTIDATDATVSGSGTKDLVVRRGSFISATGTTTTGGVLTATDTNVAAMNALSAAGAIFKE